MANIVKIYNYDKDGYITATGEMDLDIFEVVPINATIKQPPKELENLNPDEILYFDEVNDEWVLEIDENYTEPIIEEPPTDYVSAEQRIEELEMALADLMGGM